MKKFSHLETCGLNRQLAHSEARMATNFHLWWSPYEGFSSTCQISISHYAEWVPPITLLTDFGLADTYVGQVKGAILAIAPGAVLLDLTHAVPPQDLLAGAFLLWSAVGAFEPGTIHVAVVDPGVGSPRLAIALETPRGDRLVGPDNGLLVPAAERLGGIVRVVELNSSVYWRVLAPSASFHGRDIFGPVAAHLANGVPLERVGTPVDDPVRYALPTSAGGVGEVIHVDTYGNLVTNVPAAQLPPRFVVKVNAQSARLAAYYAAVPPGGLLAMIGSSGLLEISVRDGNAAHVTGAQRGTPVSVEAV
jgi:S-adenosylmethionine hydrolase